MKSSAAAPSPVPEVKTGSIMTRFIGVIMVTTAFLLPLKWGTLAAMSEAAGFFPENYSDYLQITWPAHSFGIWSGILLLLVTICCRKFPAVTAPGGLYALLWGVGVLLAVLPGYFVPGADKYFAQGEVANIAGIAAWAFACRRFIAAAPQWGRRMVVALLLGAIITALNGFYQYFFGFDEMRAFVQQQIAQGINVPEAIILKLADTRISSFMASTNALTGLMLMMLPIALYYSIKWSRLFEPAKLSTVLFIAVGVGIFGGTLLLCRSRSIFFIFLLTGLTAAFSYPRIKVRYKIAAAVAGLLLIAGGIVFAIKYGRGMGSMMERADYLRSCTILVWENPIAGAGWGGFFYRHMEVKSSDIVESARDPHNMVAAFAAQSGIPAGLVVLAALLYPLVVLWKERFSGNWHCALFWSGFLITLHILMDCDMHVPGLMAGMIILYTEALKESEARICTTWKVQVPLIAWSTALIMFSMYSNTLFLNGEWHLAQFMEFLNPVNVESRNRFAGMSMEHFEKRASEARPGLALIPELAGDWYTARGELKLAEQRYHIALKLEPRRPGIYRRLARLACMKGETAQGKAFLLEARRRFPKNPKYHEDHPENQAIFRGDTADYSRR